MVAEVTELNACPIERFPAASLDWLINFPDRRFRPSAVHC